MQPDSSIDLFHLPVPIPALDIVIFTIYRDELCVILTAPTHVNAKGKNVLPGSILTAWLTLELSFDKILQEKTGITGVYKEQLATFGDPHRDSRGHVLSIVYYALINTEMFLQGIDMTKVTLLPLREVSSETVAYDHAHIIHYARQRLEWKMEYSTIIRNILPLQFTLSQFQHMYEVVFGRAFDKRNFRKRLLSLWIISPTGDKNTTDSKRPAELYNFMNDDIVIASMIK